MHGTLRFGLASLLNQHEAEEGKMEENEAASSIQELNQASQQCACSVSKQVTRPHKCKQVMHHSHSLSSQVIP